jgi:ATP-binding cassette subfamily B multidrug efflux pump
MNKKNREPKSKQPFMGRRHGLHGLVEKPQDFKTAWRKLLIYCKPYLPAIIIALTAAAIATVLQILGPNKLKDITNEIAKGLPAFSAKNAALGSINMGAVLNMAWLLLFLYAGSALLNLVQGLIMATVTQKISKTMRTEISQKINRLPLKYFDQSSYGDVLSRVTNDVDTIGLTMNQSIGSLISALTMFVGSLIMMFYNSLLLALIAIATSLVGFFLMMVIMKKSQKHFASQQKNLGEINGHIEEIFSGHHVVKVYNGSKKARKIFEEINHKLYSSAWRSQFLSGLMMPMMHFIGNFGYVAVCVVGAVLALNGTISFGVIVAFMIYIRFFTQPLSQIAQAANNLQRTAAAGERVFELLDEVELEDESHKAVTLQDVQGNVEFRHVRFGYVPEKTVIHNFSANIKQGQKVAIVGPTGAGKTTIVNLLMRFYELDGGEILLDGMPIKKVPRENVHEQFSMVLQDSWLFEATIKDNIIYSKEGVSDEEVMDACKTVGLHRFIKALPEGYNTILNEKAGLSEGQKQLLSIARAMIQNAPLLILDEATSSVDTRTERTVQAAMDKLTAGRTSFVIAHRLSTIKNADLILVMKDGGIVESGKHQRLLQKNGFYAELYNSQFEPVA